MVSVSQPAGRREIAQAARFAAVGFAAVMFDAVGGGERAARTVAPLVRAGARPGGRRGLSRRAG